MTNEKLIKTLVSIIEDCRATLRQIDKEAFGSIHNICTTALCNISDRVERLKK